MTMLFVVIIARLDDSYKSFCFIKPRLFIPVMVVIPNGAIAE